MKRDAYIEAKQVADEIAGLRELDAQSLRKKWQELYGTKAPRCARPSLMVRAIAYKLQENAIGGAITAGRGCLLCSAHEASDQPNFLCKSQRNEAIGRRMRS